MLGRSALVRTVARANARRSMSDTPKMHKFKDCAGELKATRPPKDPHEHLVFHPPYNSVFTTAGLLAIMVTGYGTMYVGMRHQQIKQGYWK